MKQRFLLGLVVFLSALLLTSCGDPADPAPSITASVPESTAATQAAEVPMESAPADPLELLLDSMTLEEMVGQLFIVRPEDLEFDAEQDVTVLTDSMRDTLAAYPVGGVILFYQNILDPDQLTAFNASLLSACRIPPFLGVDEEGGRVARVGNHEAFQVPRYASAASVGSTGDPSAAWEMGHTIGSYLREYGFNLDFAPVADVNTNPDNPVIGDRSFSSDAQAVASMARAAASGLHDAGIIPVFKHFPGHGDTAEDSHRGIAVTNKAEAELEACEWIPFAQAGRRDCVMVGHVAVPALTGDLTPATLSPLLVRGILRDRLGFDGLIVTDSLSMGAVTDQYTSAEAALRALDAGCDLLLMPDDFREAFDAVLGAVRSGDIPREQLDRTVLRILRFKTDSGILVPGAA